MPRCPPRTAIVARAPAFAEMHDRLAGGVARTHDDDRIAAALRRLAAPRTVVHAASQQLLDAIELQAPPNHSRGGDQNRRLHLVAAGHVDHKRAAHATATAGHTTQHEHLRAEPLRLAPRHPCQLGAPDPVGEAEEVLDQGCVRGLPAG